MLRHTTCLGCGCACDDIDVVVRDGRIVDARNACALGVAWFGDGRVPARGRAAGRDVSTRGGARRRGPGCSRGRSGRWSTWRPTSRAKRKARRRAGRPATRHARHGDLRHGHGFRPGGAGARPRRRDARRDPQSRRRAGVLGDRSGAALSSLPGPATRRNRPVSTSPKAGALASSWPSMSPIRAGPPMLTCGSRCPPRQKSRRSRRSCDRGGGSASMRTALRRRSASRPPRRDAPWTIARAAGADAARRALRCRGRRRRAGRRFSAARPWPRGALVALTQALNGPTRCALSTLACRRQSFRRGRGRDLADRLSSGRRLRARLPALSAVTMARRRSSWRAARWTRSWSSVRPRSFLPICWR